VSISEVVRLLLLLTHAAECCPVMSTADPATVWIRRCSIRVSSGRPGHAVPSTAYEIKRYFETRLKCFVHALPKRKAFFSWRSRHVYCRTEADADRETC